MEFKRKLLTIPIVGKLAFHIYRLFSPSSRKFVNSKQYWLDRYDDGGNSGAGSYNSLAKHKAEVVNRIVESHGIRSVIEFGCGDGNQLKLASYPSYLGIDVSKTAIEACQLDFVNDCSKEFKTLDNYDGGAFDLGLSLDVIYHLVEDEAYNSYMRNLFDAAQKLVVIYSSNSDSQIGPFAPHVRHRKFTSWIQKEAPDWQLVSHMPNQHPYSLDPENGSFSDFYVFKKTL